MAQASYKKGSDKVCSTPIIILKNMQLYLHKIIIWLVQLYTLHGKK
jgi:hypothetical protein